VVFSWLERSSRERELQLQAALKAGLKEEEEEEEEIHNIDGREGRQIGQLFRSGAVLQKRRCACFGSMRTDRSALRASSRVDKGTV